MTYNSKIESRGFARLFNAELSAIAFIDSEIAKLKAADREFNLKKRLHTRTTVKLVVKDKLENYEGSQYR